MHVTKKKKKSNYKDWYFDMYRQYVGIPHFLKQYYEVKQKR